MKTEINLMTAHIKTVTQSFSVLLCALLPFSPLQAQNFSSGGLKFSLANGAATVTGFADTTMTALVIPATVTYNDGASYPVTAIGTYAFSGRTSLTSVTFPAGLTSIDAYVFIGCTALTSVTFPTTSSLTSIDHYAFTDCSGLTSVTLPAALTALGDYAFYQCTALTSVTLQSTTPPTLGGYAFTGVSANCTFTCPEEARSAYSADPAWAPYFPAVVTEPEPVLTNGGLNFSIEANGATTATATVTGPAEGATIPAALVITATADVFKYALIFGLASPVINLDFNLARIAAAVSLALFAYLLVILFNLFID
jgi:hypothetical protein